MPVALGTVVVNAAFLQEIKEDAQELHELLECAAVLLTGPSWIRHQPRRLARLLAGLRDQLALHFTLEEVYGYGLIDANSPPRREAQATSLRNEHQQLYLQACSLADEAEQVLYHETPEPALDRIATEFAALVDELHAHEIHENEMIAAAFDDDSRASGHSLVPSAWQLQTRQSSAKWRREQEHES